MTDGKVDSVNRKKSGSGSSGEMEEAAGHSECANRIYQNARNLAFSVTSNDG